MFERRSSSEKEARLTRKTARQLARRTGITVSVSEDQVISTDNLTITQSAQNHALTRHGLALAAEWANDNNAHINIT